jgi:hypothetical protein
VSKQQTERQGIKVGFKFSRKTPQYKREIVEAERILEICDGDLDLVLETFAILFTNKDFSFKTRNSLLPIQRDFMLSLAVAQGIRAEKEKQRQKAVSNIDRVARRENIFG